MACQPAPATRTTASGGGGPIAQQAPEGPRDATVSNAHLPTPTPWTPGIDGTAVLHEVDSLAWPADSGILPYSEDAWVSAYATSITLWRGRRAVAEHRITAMAQLRRSADGKTLITDTHTLDLATGRIEPTLDLAKTSIATGGARLERVTADPSLSRAVVTFDTRSPPGLPWFVVDLETGRTLATLPPTSDRGPAPLVAWGERTLVVGRYPSQRQVTVFATRDFSELAAVELPTYASVFAVHPARDRLAVSDPSGVIAILSMADGRELVRMATPEAPYAMTFHPNLELLAVSSRSGLRVVTLDATPKVVAHVEATADSLAFDAAGRLFASLRSISIYALTTEAAIDDLPAVARPTPEPWRPAGGDPRLAGAFALREVGQLPVFATRLAVAGGGQVFTTEGGGVTQWRGGTPEVAYDLQARHQLRLGEDGHLYGDDAAARLRDGVIDPEYTQWLDTPGQSHPQLGVEAAQVAGDGRHAVVVAKWHPLACGDCEQRVPGGADDWSLVAAADGRILAEGEGAPADRGSVAWTGTAVAIAAGPRGVQVRSRDDGRLLQTLEVAGPAFVHARADEFITLAQSGSMARWAASATGPKRWTKHELGRLPDVSGEHPHAFHPAEPLLAIAVGSELRVFRYEGSVKRAATKTIEGSPLDLAFGPNHTLWVAAGHHGARPPRVIRLAMGEP